ncbi:MAG: DUF3990 domain-containing protein [Oscillospiraceae bacterium]|jgi:hypothetical protein|nr:DUF3990 domain-containing protein [Oscillospiraceae bacterium]
MLLYHGSNMAVEKPKLIVQTRGLDFGDGFYLTSNEGQAKRFADTVVERRGIGVPTVNMYEYDEATAKATLDIAIFPEANVEWLAFVRDNRLKSYTGKPYDIVFGPVADDRVFPTIQALVIKQFTIEATLLALKPFKLFNQYCFTTERALSMLRFVKSIALGGKIND